MKCCQIGWGLFSVIFIALVSAPLCCLAQAASASVTADVFSASNIGTWATLSAIVWAVGLMLKQSPVPDWLIPFILVFASPIGYCALEGFTGKNVMTGIFCATATITAHQLVKQGKSRDKDEQDTANEAKEETRPSGPVVGFALLILTSVLFIGCAINTPTNPPPNNQPAVYKDTNGFYYVYGRRIDPDRTAKVVYVLSKDATIAGCQADPNAKAYLQAVSQVIAKVTDSGNYDPEKLRQSLDKISVKEVRDNSDVKQGIMAAMAVYDLFAVDVVTAKIDQSIYLGPVLASIQKGISDGLPK